MAKYLDRAVRHPLRIPYVLTAVSFFFVEVFAFLYLRETAAAFSLDQLWPLAFGALWSVILSGILRLLPWKGGRTAYGVVYFLSLVYAVGQTGYFQLFHEMMWLSEFLYASEGADYLDVMMSYPPGWYLWILGLAGLGCLISWKFPRWGKSLWPRIGAAFLAVLAAVCAWLLPELVFLQDGQIRYAGSDYGRMQSAEAAYVNIFNVHRLYQVCGLYQTAGKDIYANAVFPHTPGYLTAQKQDRETIAAYFANDLDSTGSNDMTGRLRGKNVILVLMESMDDWMIGTHTPTIARLMEEGISFTNFYTPPYGGIRTFNTEFCINTGSFLSSQGGYAFDYVTNSYNQSLANILSGEGYSAKTFHYNDPSFYSRGVFSKALGYEEYVCYADYLGDVDEEQARQLLFDDKLLFDNPQLRDVFFREGPKLNFVITRSAHLSYKYNEVLSYWGLKQYPQYRDLTGNEETDCALLKARLVDDFFAGLLRELEETGQLEDTVIIGVTDHYTYGYKDTDTLLALSGVEAPILLEKTPCFIWYPGCEAMEVDKILNTSDLLPTVLNMLGLKPGYDYIGHDAFDPSYDGFVPFSDGSWISGGYAYDIASDLLIPLEKGNAAPDPEEMERMAQRVHWFTDTNNLILETDYYKKASR